MTDERQQKLDMEFLARRAEFKRFLWRVIQSAGILAPTTDGSVERTFELLGRRKLGLEILEMAEQGQPIPDVHKDGPLLTLIQVLIEETQQQPAETKNGRRNPERYDRNAELADDAGSESDAE